MSFEGSSEEPPRSLDLSSFGKRKSAFQPYRPTTTVLTNLQRGNTQANIPKEIKLNFYEKAAQGEITKEDVENELKDVDEADDSGYTALHWACFYGQLSSATVLVGCGADVNKEAPEMVTPLLLAAAGGHNEIVRLLLRKGAKVDHMDIVGNTALMFAAAGNHPHTTKEILEYHPDVTETNEHGESAYSLAVKREAHLSQAVIEAHLTMLLTS